MEIKNRMMTPFSRPTSFKRSGFSMARFLTWGALFLLAVGVMAFAFGMALGLGVPPKWAAYPMMALLAHVFATRMFQALGLD